MFEFLILLILVGGILFYNIQMRIGQEQEYARRKFIRDNPQLMIAYKHSDLYSRALKLNILEDSRNK